LIDIRTPFAKPAHMGSGFRCAPGVGAKVLASSAKLGGQLQQPTTGTAGEKSRPPLDKV
jgi:hypothetical protein